VQPSRLSVFCITALLLLSSASIAKAEPDAHVQAILREGWDTSPEGLREAERRYESAPGGIGAQADYAMALVLFKHRRLEEGVTALDSATKRSPGHLAAWRAKFWMLAVLRKYDACIAEMQALADIYPAGPKQPDVEAELVETARWMGRVHGHLTWAAPNVKLPMETHTKALAGRLTGDKLTAFEEGREEVRLAHTKLSAELNKVQSEEAAAEADRRAKIAEENKRERERIGTERAGLAAAGKEAQDQATMRVEEIDSQLAPLKKEYGDLQRRAAPILDRINDLERDIRETERDARSTKDDRRKRDLQRDADRLRSRQREEERRLDPIQRDMTRVKKEAAVFETQRAQVAAAFQAVALQINQNLALLAKAEKEVERSERQLLEPAKPTPKQLAMTNKMSALTTWLPFPLEEERDRLLSGK
jgi:hypothetical protein